MAERVPALCCRWVLVPRAVQVKCSVKESHRNGQQAWQQDGCLDRFIRGAGKKATPGGGCLPGLVSLGLGRVRDPAQDRRVRGPREVFLSTLPCPECSGNSQEQAQNLGLVGLQSTLLLPQSGWNPSAPNGPEAISTIDCWPGCGQLLPG